MPRLLHVATVPDSLLFLRGQASFMRERGFEVTVVTSPGDDLPAFGTAEGVSARAVPMTRRITPLSDLVSLFRLCRIVRDVQPDIVHAHTPKGGLLGTLAGVLSGVPVIVYHARGLPLLTATGRKRALLKMTERLACGLATDVICVSHSLRAVFLEQKLCPEGKLQVLLGGSGNGVDSEGRFNPDRHAGARGALRESLEIPQDALVFGFVGRLVRDKGVVELADAWARLQEELPHARLLVIGKYEEEDPVPERVREVLARDERVHLVGFVPDVAPYYAAMDVVVLPTYREGFPNVPLEASSMGLPVVATRVPGCVDAVKDGVTGTLVEPRDALALRNAMRVYASTAELRSRHGHAGRERVVREFRRERTWQELHAFYRRRLEERSGVRSSLSSHRSRCLKRALDVAAAGTALVTLSPVLVGLICAELWFHGWPPLFAQKRPGKGGRIFTLYKFRTMSNARGPDGALLPDAVRLTRFGRFLRSTSLDELPELWNVLKGDMSLVGPRPLLVRYLDRYTSEQHRRHEVLPGLTGWAQIHGRNALSWEEKFALDVWYVDHWSLSLDIRILLRTLRAVLAREGITAEGSATMPEFMGTEGEP